MSETGHVRLPNPPGALRRWVAGHQRAVDITIVVCYLIGALPLAASDMLTTGFGRTSVDLVALVGYTALLWLRVVAGVIALLIRRTAPLRGLIIIVVTLIGEVGMLSIANGVALCFLIYAVPVYRNVRAGWIGYTIAVVGGMATWIFQPLLEPVSVFGAQELGDNIASGVASAVWLLAILLIGINLGNRRRYLQAIIDRAHQLAKERDQLALLAVAEERSRLAREIHDIVAHSVSVMIALSEGGARAIDVAPEAAAQAMQRSAETGRTALAEMRRLLGALQADEAAELAPQPGREDIPALVQGFADAGLTVTLIDETGQGAIERLEGLAMYRVVQEGLTNVLRYAGEGAVAQVSLESDDSGTSVTVRDYGRAAGATGPLTGLGSGRGLAGLAERLRVFGGTIHSGPVPAQPGWRIRAHFPATPPATPQKELS